MMHSYLRRALVVTSGAAAALLTRVSAAQALDPAISAALTARTAKLCSLLATVPASAKGNLSQATALCAPDAPVQTDTASHAAVLVDSLTAAEASVNAELLRPHVTDARNAVCKDFNSLLKNTQNSRKDTLEPASKLCASEPSPTSSLADLQSEFALVDSAQAALAVVHADQKSGAQVVKNLLDARCAVAICFGNDNAIGIEPLVELPVGKSFSVSSGPVADYVNNHDIRVDLAAGVRVWAFRDFVSLAVYLSTPLTDRGVRIPGSEFEYPATALRRPYPGVAIGALYDSIWIGFDHDQLRNPDSTSGTSHDPTYPPNALVGSSWTITLALQPVTAFRTGIGLLAKGKE